MVCHTNDDANLLIISLRNGLQLFKAGCHVHLCINFFTLRCVFEVIKLVPAKIISTLQMQHTAENVFIGDVAAQL